jgi:hypothetical protein
MGAHAQVVVAQRILDPETVAWRDGIAAQFLVSTPNQRAISIANSLIEGIKAASYNSKIKYFLPLLGHDLVGATMPLRDSLAAGPAGATAFNNADFSQALGLQGDGVGKFVDTLITPAQLGTSNSGGIGYWENNIDFTGTADNCPMGCRGAANTQNFMAEVYSSARGVMWGAVANRAGDSTAATNGHYYGQRSSATLREAFFNGASLGTNTTNDTATGAGDATIYVMGQHKNSGLNLFWKGRCAAAYLTDGTMTAGEIAAFDALLRQNLFAPTGRPAS